MPSSLSATAYLCPLPSLFPFLGSYRARPFGVPLPTPSTYPHSQVVFAITAHSTMVLNSSSSIRIRLVRIQAASSPFLIQGQHLISMSRRKMDTLLPKPALDKYVMKEDGHPPGVPGRMSLSTNPSSHGIIWPVLNL